jgi:Ras-related protein Rab-2A
MVFDITRRETFESIRNWHREAIDNGNSKMKFLLIGNKTDLEIER